MSKIINELNHFRKILGLRKGTIIIFSAYHELIAVGYLNTIVPPPVNDNEAKP